MAYKEMDARGIIKNITGRKECREKKKENNRKEKDSDGEKR